MNSPPPLHAAGRASRSTLRIGVLAPLSPPGWVAAGEQLLEGLELAVSDVNMAGGIDGRPIELVVYDTSADPQKAVDAVDKLASSGVAALAGEFHSVAARAAASRAAAIGMPFLCSSAILDVLIETPTDWVARIAPAQSHGWRIYADVLRRAGHTRIAAVTQPSAYWAAGMAILRGSFADHGGSVIEINVNALDPGQISDKLAAQDVTALLLLVGYPEPALAIVRLVRDDPRLADLLIGAPAGQSEFPQWINLLGAGGAAIPFLRYLPDRLSPLGSRVETRLRERIGAAPSFIAFEGYDTIAVLAHILSTHGTEPTNIAAAWSTVSVEGTRGLVRFSRVPGIGVWQWAWAPVQVVDRDPTAPDQFRILYSS